MSPITTHVLDTSLGRPAVGVAIRLEFQEGGHWIDVGHGSTDDDGRLRTLLPSDKPVKTGIYRMSFDTAEYFREQGVGGFYPEIPIIFEVSSHHEHYHVPLLLSPFGYSTYRGS